MAISERRQREKQKRINDILDAAEDLMFGEAGMDVSIDTIAAKAEVSKGTVYFYFDSKDLIYLGIGVRSNELLQKKMMEVLAKESRGLDKALAICQTYYRFAKDYPNYFHIKSQADNHMQTVLTANAEHSIAMRYHEVGFANGKTLRDAINEGLEDQSISDKVNPSIAVYTLWAQANGVIQLIQTKGKTMKEHMGVEPEDLWGNFIDWTRKCLT